MYLKRPVGVIYTDLNSVPKRTRMCKSLCSNGRDDHQNLKLLLTDLNQMHLIGLVERNILVF